MDLREAEIRNISELCSVKNPKKTLPMKVVIPFYQRPYKWETNRIERLIEDFYKNATKNVTETNSEEETNTDDESESENNNFEYFIGSVVMVAPSANSSRYSVIDGQQRLTTLFLLEYIHFLLLRSYIETLIIIRQPYSIDSLLKNLEAISSNIFGNSIKDKISKVRIKLLEMFNVPNSNTNKDKQFENAIREYNSNLFLPETRNNSNDDYKKAFCNLLRNLLNDSKNDLALSYSRSSFIDKMIDALSSIFVTVTSDADPTIESLVNSDDEIIKQYVNSTVCLFSSIYKKVAPTENPLQKAQFLIDDIETIIKNIKLCVIITGKEKDAYTLFEVLNDRALELDDLDLIKNLFYQWYCNHSTESEAAIEACIDEVDKLWVDEIFTQDLGVERSKVISYFTAEYFTADEGIKYAETARYRDPIETKYLKHHDTYTSKDIKNDIYIYQMMSILLKKFEFAVNNKNERVIDAEVSDKSITYRAFHLLNALKQYGVLAAITNTIIRKYIDTNKLTSDGYYDVAGFEEYLSQLINDKSNNTEKFLYIHQLSYDFWKLSLMCNKADTPREEAKKVIEKINAFNNTFDYALASSTENKLIEAFPSMMKKWRFGKNDSDLRAKVLFINLFYTTKNENKLEMKITRKQFRTNKLHLDHLEADKPIQAVRECYFSPQTTDRTREDYVNSIGNFMILDQEDNNNKRNYPLSRALQFYDNMCEDHWIIKEIKTLIQTDKNCYTKQGDVHVPNANFFITREDRLINYFVALLRCNLNSTQTTI